MVATENFRSDDFNLTTMILDSVASLLAAILYQGNPDRNHKLWNCFVTAITDWNGIGQTTIDEL
jgi:hypothetical protein